MSNYNESMTAWRRAHPEWKMPRTPEEAIERLEKASRLIGKLFGPFQNINDPLVEVIADIDSSWVVLEGVQWPSGEEPKSQAKGGEST